MLIGIEEKSGLRTTANEAGKTTSYFCPCCGEELVLRKGKVRIHHFAHLPAANCPFKGESQTHLRIKQAIFDRLNEQYGSQVKRIDLEVSLGVVRPDILLQGTRKQIAIEIQASSLTTDEIRSRTESYRRLNIHVLWVVPFDPKRMMDQYGNTRSFRVLNYELYFSYLYYNNLVLWDEHQRYSNNFIVLQLEDTFTEKTVFYSTDHSALIDFAPKRRKYIKAVKRIAFDVPLSDFKPVVAKAYSNKFVQLPPRLGFYYNWQE